MFPFSFPSPCPPNHPHMLPYYPFSSHPIISQSSLKLPSPSYTLLFLLILSQPQFYSNLSYHHNLPHFPSSYQPPAVLLPFLSFVNITMLCDHLSSLTACFHFSRGLIALVLLPNLTSTLSTSLLQELTGTYNLSSLSLVVSGAALFVCISFL